MHHPFLKDEHKGKGNQGVLGRVWTGNSKDCRRKGSPEDLESNTCIVGRDL